MAEGVACSNSPLMSGESQPVRWVRGTITVMNGITAVKAEGRGPRDVKPVLAARCEGCGYLEFYAP